jgi:hypothetical protein
MRRKLQRCPLCHPITSNQNRGDMRRRSKMRNDTSLENKQPSQGDGEEGERAKVAWLGGTGV